MSADASGLALTLSFKEKGQFSRARDVQKRKTVAHGGGVEALSGWGTKADFKVQDKIGPVTENEARLG